MDTIQNQAESLFDSSSILEYLGLILLLIALYFIRKYLYKLDEYLNSKNNNSNNYIGKPWHISWSLILGIIFLLTQVLSSGQSDRFIQEHINVFFNNPHFWHWFWLLLLMAEIIMFIVVIYQSLTHFGKYNGIIRSVVIILLMCLYFWAGMYMGLIFATVVGLYFIYRIFTMFYGREKGLLTG